MLRVKAGELEHEMVKGPTGFVENISRKKAKSKGRLRKRPNLNEAFPGLEVVYGDQNIGVRVEETSDLSLSLFQVLRRSTQFEKGSLKGIVHSATLHP
jgi:hypothetical protein